MNKKKMLYIGLLVGVVIIIGIFAFIIANRTERLVITNDNSNLGNKNTNSNNVNQTVQKETKTATVTTLDDGILYSVGETITPDIVIGDEYFDTQMADINLNFSNYEGKTVEIEGMYLTNLPFTFVGRYSTANICPACPPGYSYMEYEWIGDKKPELTEEQSWLKVVGTFKKGNDAGTEYYYIDVASMEVMNQAGLATVTN